jgi:adapter protein MecA 1/2
MEIERINENTVKFYISYLDIEERGFDREDIWYNRERSEELFWEMMDEIHQEEEFTIEGPLWIQVQALDKGLEVLVTKAQVSKDGHRYELPIPDEKLKDLPVDERIESLLDQQLDDDGDLHFILLFQDFEDVILLANRIKLGGITNKLYTFDGKYYLFVEFEEEAYTEEELDNLLSLLLEYGQESALTIFRLEEYGKEVIASDALSIVAKHFHN